jgi:Ca2+-binding RTX toxin-like protein
LIAGNGNDSLEGGTGADTIDGGAGIDIISYVHAKAGVNVSLQLGYGLGGEAAGDKYINVEGVLGSDFNDTIVGSNADNLLAGFDGDDYINGGAGADTIDGGNGNDTVSYATSRAAVNVDLNGFMTGAHFDGQMPVMGHGGDAEGDLLLSVERIIGSNFNDQITGSYEANTIEGGAGNDTLNGGYGDDVLSGGIGADQFVFDAHNGKDIVSDFKASQGDVLDFVDTFGTNFREVMSHATQVGTSVVFTAGEDQVTLKNVILSSIKETNVNIHEHLDFSDMQTMTDHTPGLMVA